MESQSEHSIDVALDDHDERGGVARLVVDYQARLNILNSELIRQLAVVVKSLADNERLRVVILTGAGDRAFIGGADINEMGSPILSPSTILPRSTIFSRSTSHPLASSSPYR